MKKSILLNMVALVGLLIIIFGVGDIGYSHEDIEHKIPVKVIGGMLFFYSALYQAWKNKRNNSSKTVKK